MAPTTGGPARLGLPVGHRAGAATRAEDDCVSAISTGIYGFTRCGRPHIAVTTIRAALKTPTIEKVTFACVSTTVVDAYRAEGVDFEP
ncbi:MAG: hypothetical protein R2712_12470 [Vicinamibacterales bacterium]